MNIDFNFPLRGLDGEIVKNEKNEAVIAGKVLANVLVGQSQGDAVKLFDWATALYRGEALTLDNSDTQTLKTFISESQTMTILLKHELLGRMEMQKIKGRENHKEPAFPADKTDRF